MTLKEQLEGEIQSRLSLMVVMKTNSDEYKQTVAMISRLLERYKDIESNEISAEKAARDNDVEIRKLAIESRKLDVETRRIDLEAIKEANNAHDNKVKNGIAIGTFVGTTAAYIWANIYNWWKESGGIMSSTGGKNAISVLTKLIKK